MTSNPDYQKILQRLINRNKWWDILSRFIDVLHVNIFIVDKYGNVIVPPEEGRFGGRLLSDIQLKTGLQPGLNYIERFEKQNDHLELTNSVGISCYALPIITAQSIKNPIVAYLIIGPLIPNKKREATEYEKFARLEGIEPSLMFDQLTEIRIVSNLMIKSIIDLLKTIIRDTIDLIEREKENSPKSDIPQQETNESERIRKEIYSSLRLDELLITLLDVALKITKTECGSIMICDEDNKTLQIKVSRGIDLQKLKNINIKIGEGISGLAAQSKESFVIEGQQSQDNRIKSYLRRPEIKRALVMPLVVENKLLGVLNLHTTKSKDNIEDNIENLQHLSKLLASVYSSV